MAERCFVETGRWRSGRDASSRGATTRRHACACARAGEQRAAGSERQARLGGKNDSAVCRSGSNSTATIVRTVGSDSTAANDVPWACVGVFTCPGPSSDCPSPPQRLHGQPPRPRLPLHLAVHVTRHASAASRWHFTALDMPRPPRPVRCRCFPSPASPSWERSATGAWTRPTTEHSAFPGSPGNGGAVRWMAAAHKSCAVHMVYVYA